MADIEGDAVDTGWDGINSDNEGGASGGSVFVKMKKRSEPYRFRMVTSPVPFRKHWSAFNSLRQYPISPALESSEKDLDVAWSRGDFVPRRRFACLVLDREADSALKVLEGGPQIFGVFGDYADLAKKNPAGPNGPDWIIKVKDGENGQTKYVVQADPSGPKPFTAEEMDRINKSKLSKKYIEEHYYAKATPEEIRDLWLALPEDRQYSSDEAKSKDAGRRVASPGADIKGDTAPKTPTESVKSAEPPEEKVAEVKSETVASGDKPAELF